MLTEQLREDYHPEFISLYWGEIAMGRDPRVTLRDHDPKTGKRRNGAPSKAGIEEVPTLAESATAMARIEMRRDGAPAQQIQLDADLRARSLSTNVAAQDLERMAQLSPIERRAAMARLRADIAEMMGGGKDQGDAFVPSSSENASRALPASSSADEGGTPELPAGVGGRGPGGVIDV